jgi:aminopeptidase N
MRKFASADNMTDQFAALATLAQHDCGERAHRPGGLLRALAGRSAGGRQVAVGAGVEPPAGDPGGRPKQAAPHPAFDLHNPNKVYALLNTFGNNHVRFHAADGSGYRFLAEADRALDREPAGCGTPGTALRSLAPLRCAATGARLA